MPEKPQPYDDCSNCTARYYLTPETAKLQLFLQQPECNFIWAQCPGCDYTVRIFITVETACSLLEVLPILIFPEPPADVAAAWRKVNPDAVQEPAEEELVIEQRKDDDVFISERRLRELRRDLDAFEHGVDG